jgi:hypothetical protein
VQALGEDHAPVIQWEPRTSLPADRRYVQQVVASDLDGDTVRFERA